VPKHLPKKKFGQHFLVDEDTIQRVIGFIHPQNVDHLIEIGPGLGAITLPLLSYGAFIDAIELDPDIIPLLDKKVSGKGNITIHQQNALSLRLDQLVTEKKALRIVGNLPYNIATPLLFHLFDQQKYILDMHFMLQKEVALRLAASPGSKKYGRLSVMAQYHCNVELLLTVPPDAFTPPPKVHSMFIRLIPIEPIEKANNITLLGEVVKEAFSKRRKTLSNALKNMVSKKQLISLGINPSQRPEELTVRNFIQISNILG
jgi:16S rRNA (adenine1518-N6/adenine1519-N6)-dimethyltransferase